MSSLVSPDTFDLFAQYLLAGYVVIIVRSRFVAGLRPKPAELIIEAVIFSLLVQLIWLVFEATLFPLFASVLGETVGLSERLVFLAKVLVLPAALGMALGAVLSSRWKDAVFRRLSLPIVHPSETGYDYWFGNAPEPGIVIVTYFDGVVVAGYFGERSLAASNPEPRDLLLEYMYSVDDQGELSEPLIKRAALISLQNVRSIEFLEKGQ